MDTHIFKSVNLFNFLATHEFPVTFGINKNILERDTRHK